MRVVSGKYKGRRILPPKKFPSRPTTDFAKESLFNILENKIDWENTEVLDLFSGTGALGLECISRGAKHVLSVDKHPVSIRHLNKLRDEFEEDWNILRKDALKFIPDQHKQYDLILIDPPFDLPKMQQIPDMIFDAELLAENGLMVLEHDKKVDFSKHPKLIDERRYGGVHFSFFSN